MASDSFVLHSTALLGYLRDGRGAAEVERLLERAARGRAEIWLCAIDLGRALVAVELDVGAGGPERVLGLVQQLPVRVRSADHELACDAAYESAREGIPLLDAFAVALAREVGAKLVHDAPALGGVSPGSRGSPRSDRGS